MKPSFILSTLGIVLAMELQSLGSCPEQQYLGCMGIPVQVDQTAFLELSVARHFLSARNRNGLDNTSVAVIK